MNIICSMIKSTQLDIWSSVHQYILRFERISVNEVYLHTIYNSGEWETCCSIKPLPPHSSYILTFERKCLTLMFLYCELYRYIECWFWNFTGWRYKDWLRSYLPYTNYMQRFALNIKQLNTAFINVHNYSIDYNKHWINNK